MATLVGAGGRTFELQPLAYEHPRPRGNHDRVVVRVYARDEDHAWSAILPAFDADELWQFARASADIAERGGSGIFAGREPELEVGCEVRDGEASLVMTFAEALLPPGVSQASYQIHYRVPAADLQRFALQLADELCAFPTRAVPSTQAAS